ncbi:hypothetical protein EJB05_11194 [Eragrostis curvula]|uniref:Cyclin N-terminal domain-containing protein n=1 Tax=Eragrostis curvula TaxID=38414 RepID=A0A5J9VNV1_9POAL|nr:hypothetical protein EJB05_11194 [Eragrostis curvula]
MGILCVGTPSTLLCGEDRNSVLGLGGCNELAEVESGLDFFDAAGALFPVDTDEVVRELMEKEMDHLPQAGYAERLEQGGLEASWRKDGMDWICKAHSYYNFGPLSLCLAVNYLDRFISSYNLPHDKPWTQQLLSVACLSVAVKMEETVVPLLEDLQVCDSKPLFDAKLIRRMELHVMKALNWRMQAVTPFAFINYFLDKFNGGKPPSFALASRCAEIIVGTMKGSAFLSFRPSVIAAAAALAAVSENQIVGLGDVLATFEIPVNKEMVVRCYELMQGQALVKRVHNGSPSVPQSPIGVLDAACFNFRSNDATLGSSQSNNEALIPASKRRKLRISPI